MLYSTRILGQCTCTMTFSAKVPVVLRYHNRICQFKLRSFSDEFLVHMIRNISLMSSCRPTKI